MIYMLHSYFFCVLHTSLLLTSLCPTLAISLLGKSLTSSKHVSNLKNSTRKMNKIIKMKQRYKIGPGNKSENVPESTGRMVILPYHGTQK